MAFSAENTKNYLHGMDDTAVADHAALRRLPPMDPLLGHDECRVWKEYLNRVQNLTLAESMLRTSHHMQVNVCYLRDQHNHAPYRRISLRSALSPSSYRIWRRTTS